VDILTKFSPVSETAYGAVLETPAGGVAAALFSYNYEPVRYQLRFSYLPAGDGLRVMLTAAIVSGPSSHPMDGKGQRRDLQAVLQRLAAYKQEWHEPTPQ